ncbi:condensation domain-containing protein [Streptomyces sp. M19]
MGAAAHPAGLDRDRLAELLRALVDCHDLLRARLDDQGRLRVAGTAPVRLRYVADDPLVHREAAVDRLDPATGRVFEAVWREGAPGAEGACCWWRTTSPWTGCPGGCWRATSPTPGRAGRVPCPAHDLLPSLGHGPDRRRPRCRARPLARGAAYRGPAAGRGHGRLGPGRADRGAARGRHRAPAHRRSLGLPYGRRQCAARGAARAVNRWRGTRAPGAAGGGGARPRGVGGARRRTVAHRRLVHRPAPGGAHPDPDPATSVKDVKERLAATPADGLGYGLLRHVGGEFAAEPRPQVLVNYLGRFGVGGGAFAIGAFGGGRDPRMVPAHVVEVDALAEERADGAVLTAVWSFDRARLTDADARALADAWLAALRELAALEVSDGGHTPSDFPWWTWTGGGWRRWRRRIRTWPTSCRSPAPGRDARAHPAHRPRRRRVHRAGRLRPRRRPGPGPAAGRLPAAAGPPPGLRSCFPGRGAGRGGTGHAALDDHRTGPGRRDVGQDRAGPGARRGPRAALRPGPPAAAARASAAVRRAAAHAAAERAPRGGRRLVAVRALRRVVPAVRGDRALDAPAPGFAAHLSWLARQDATAAARAWADALEGAKPTLFAAPVAEDPTLLPRRTPCGCPSGTPRRCCVRPGAGPDPGVLVRTAWALTLRELSGAEDLLLGATVSGRSPEVPDMAAVVGLHTNIVPVRVRQEVGESPADLAARLQAEYAAAVPHQHHGWSAVAEDLGHGPLFAGHMVFHNYPLDTSALTRMGEVVVRGVEVRDGTHYPLSLVARQDGAELALRVDHRPDVFTEAEAHEVGNRLLSHLRALAWPADARAERRRGCSGPSRNTRGSDELS